jgi:hypothetical protein
MSSIWPLPGNNIPDTAEKIKKLSRLKYGQDRTIVEAEIMKRVKAVAGFTKE